MPRLVDSDALKEWIENWFVKNAYYHPYSKSNTIPIPELYDILERMPTVDAVRHGHWTNISISVTGNSSAECSLCGTVVHDTFADVNRINYCPNCGAKMDDDYCSKGRESKN